MRFLLVLLLVPSIALAKPKVAIAPFEGDEDHKVANAVAEAAGDDAEITSPKATKHAMASLGLSGELDKKDVKKLRGKLSVDVVVQGKVLGKKQKTLELRVAGKGVKTATFAIKFKNAMSTKFHDDVRDELGKHLGTGGDEEEDEEDKPKRLVDEDKPRRKRESDDEDDDGRSAHKKKRHHRDDDAEDEPPRHAVTQVAVRVNAGAGFGRRTLTYDGAGTTKPPPVGTAGASGTLEAEVYPGATSTLKGLAASIGIYAAYDKTVGVKIAVPGTKVEAGVDQAHYAIGVRYRIPIGSSSLAFGAAYARWHYIADRSGLMMPTALDMPDVDYAAIAPGAVARIAASDQLGVFFGADAMLMLGAGPIVEATNYGFADIIAFDITGGIDYALGANYALRFAAELTQFGLSFTNKGMSQARGVSSATDRLVGISATFAVTY